MGFPLTEVAFVAFAEAHMGLGHDDMHRDFLREYGIEIMDGDTKAGFKLRPYWAMVEKHLTPKEAA